MCLSEENDRSHWAVISQIVQYVVGERCFGKASFNGPSEIKTSEMLLRSFITSTCLVNTDSTSIDSLSRLLVGSSIQI